MYDRSLGYDDGPREIEIRRRDSIEGQVEKPEETAERKRLEIAKQRKEHGDACKKGLRAKDKAKADYRRVCWELAASAVVVPPIAFGWVSAIMWGAATSFTGGRGGPLTFYIIGLIVLTIIDGLCLSVSYVDVVDKRTSATEATHTWWDAVETKEEFEATQKEIHG